MAETKLEQKRNESADVPAIAKIGLAETVDHEFLFDRHLQVETDRTGEDGKEAADKSMLQRRTEKSDEETGVDGVAHGAVGAATINVWSCFIAGKLLQFSPRVSRAQMLRPAPRIARPRPARTMGKVTVNTG